MGKGGKEFSILKFRTMYEGEKNGNGSKVTAQDDPRITPIGRWLRNTKINEIPQLWNVLVGEMSLVGPRPEDPDIVRAWPEEYQQLLLSVRPGVTSPATIIYRDEETLLSTEGLMEDYLKEILPTKMRLDKLYMRNRSIITDLDVIFWTAIALLPKMDRLNIPQHYLYWGPFSRIFGRIITWFTIDTLITFVAVRCGGGGLAAGRSAGCGDGHVACYTRLGISLVFSLMNWIFRLDKVEWSRAPAGYVFLLGISTFISMMVVISLDKLNPYSELPVRVIIYSFRAFAGWFYRGQVPRAVDHGHSHALAEIT